MITYSIVQQLQHDARHGIPCTCCGYRNENRNGSRYQSSWFVQGAFRESIEKVNNKIDSELLDTYNVDRNDFTSSLLHLTELLQKVPETGLCNNNVRSENAHTEELGSDFLSGGELTSNHLIFGVLIKQMSSLLLSGSSRWTEQEKASISSSKVHRL